MNVLKLNNYCGYFCIYRKFLGIKLNKTHTSNFSIIFGKGKTFVPLFLFPIIRALRIINKFSIKIRGQSMIVVNMCR